MRQTTNPEVNPKPHRDAPIKRAVLKKMSYSLTSESDGASFAFGGQSPEEKEKDKKIAAIFVQACELAGAEPKFNGNGYLSFFAMLNGEKCNVSIGEDSAPEEVAQKIVDYYNGIVQKRKDAVALCEQANRVFSRIKKPAWRGQVKAHLSRDGLSVDVYPGSILIRSADIKELQDAVQKGTGVSLRWMLQ